jgi:large subunit ribosomal protein L6
MSRVGKNPIPIPEGVTVTTRGRTVVVKGPKGELQRDLTGSITAAVEDGKLLIRRGDDLQQTRALHGLYRALCNGMVQGVTKGYERRLEIVGVSYQGSVTGDRLRLQIGFSHPVMVPIPKGITVSTPQPTQIVVQGIDKQLVGQFAATVRHVRPPEPYKGKGVRYVGERVVQKAGKSFVGGEK